ncbi:MAG: hypothetical protein ABI921_14050 [Panacibacter sp.]
MIDPNVQECDARGDAMKDYCLVHKIIQVHITNSQPFYFKLKAIILVI